MSIQYEEVQSRSCSLSGVPFAHSFPLSFLPKTRRVTRRRHRVCALRYIRRRAPVEDSALRVRDEGKDGLWWMAHRFNELWHEEDIVVPCVRLLPS
jgi:hypothetical protein